MKFGYDQLQAGRYRLGRSAIKYDLKIGTTASAILPPMQSIDLFVDIGKYYQNLSSLSGSCVQAYTNVDERKWCVFRWQPL